MEPTSVVTGISAVLKAAESINKILTDAHNWGPDDARYYGTWITVASEAIKGLEQAYIEILIEAEHCQVNDQLRREHLCKRINEYIKGEVLRPRLRDAIDHLSAGRKALQQHADKLLIWPSAKTNRAVALDRYDQLLNALIGYKGKLGDYNGDSAVGLKDLRDVHGLLVSGSLEAFKEKVSDLLMNLDKAECVMTTGECARTIETLRIAFR
jgi:hypothetical protein